MNEVLKPLTQIYNRVEVSHHVFCVLFCNILAALIITLLNIAIVPWNQTIKYDTIVTMLNVFGGMFHFCSWEVATILRYLYIVHPDIIDTHFQDYKRLTCLSICGLLSLFATNAASVLIVPLLNGWPKIKPVEMAPKKFAIYILIATTFLTASIGVSCGLTLLLLKKRGQIRSVQVMELSFIVDLHTVNFQPCKCVYIFDIF
jgi:hypothetical protein